MRSSPKIIVLKMREIVYTVVLLFLAVLLILCLILMFSGRQSQSVSDQMNSAQTDTASSQPDTNRPSQYTPGIYTSSITLGESAVDVEVTVDSDLIKSIRLVNLSDSVTASYPLITPAMEYITSQILEKQSLENITASQENRYTSQLLLSAVSDALSLARGTLSS